MNADMKTPDLTDARKAWETPTLTEHGSLLDVTRATGGVGPGDGLFDDGPS